MQHFKQVTPVVSPVELPFASSNCKVSSRTLRLHYEDSVIANGIPSYQTMDMFVMVAELAAMRRQQGRNASALTVRAIGDMNSTHLFRPGTLLTLGSARCLSPATRSRSLPSLILVRFFIAAALHAVASISHHPLVCLLRR